jgi:hypothetical protein
MQAEVTTLSQQVGLYDHPRAILTTENQLEVVTQQMILVSGSSCMDICEYCDVWSHCLIMCGGSSS